MLWRLPKRRRRQLLFLFLPLVVAGNLFSYVVYVQNHRSPAEQAAESYMVRENILDSVAEEAAKDPPVPEKPPVLFQKDPPPPPPPNRPKSKREYLRGKVSSLMNRVLEPLIKAEKGESSAGGGVANAAAPFQRRKRGKRRNGEDDKAAMMPMSSLGSGGGAESGFGSLPHTFMEVKRRRKNGIGSKAEDVSEMPPPPAQAQMEEREFIPPINEEEEEEENDSLLPVQENPWVDMNSTAEHSDPLGEFIHSRMEEEETKCLFRQFENHTAYSRPEFAEEYSGFRMCSDRESAGSPSGSPSGSLAGWLSRRIRARRGKWGELLLDLKFHYEKDLEDPLWCSQEGSPPRPPTVLYLVQTSLSPSGRERREAARRSWAAGGALPAGQRAVFVSGRRRAAAPGAGAGAAASGEGEGDLVVTEVEEGDPDFGVKQVAAAMAWVYSRCELTRFVAFVTDSTFVNAKRFQMFAEMEMSSANRLYGDLLKRMEPDRDRNGEHWVSSSEWPWKYFPPFLRGPSLIASGDVLPRLLVAARILSPLRRLPQVFFTGLAPLVNRVMRIGVSEFFQPEFESEREDECSWAMHGVIEGVTEPRWMSEVFQQVDHLQRVRNVTCTIHTSCSVRVDGKCLFKSAGGEGGDSKKKKKGKKGKRKP